MSYTVHNFAAGDIIHAEDLNEMDAQIAANEEAAVVDATLSQEGKPADAKATGDEITDLKADLIQASVSYYGDENTNPGANIQWLQKHFQVPSNYDRLTDKTAVSNSTFNNAGVIVNGSYLVFYQYIKVEPNTSYVMSGANYYGATRGYDANKVVVTNGTSKNGKILTTGEGVYYVRISVNNTADPNNIKFQLGETASAKANLTMVDVDLQNESVKFNKLLSGWQKNNCFVYFSTVNSVIATEVDSSSLLIRWAGELLCRGKYSNGWTTASMANALGEDYSAIGSDEQTYVKIPSAMSLIIDTGDSSKRLKVIQRTEYDDDKHILLIECANGIVVKGVFSDLLASVAYQNTKSNLSTIEDLQTTIQEIKDSGSENNMLLERETECGWAIGNIYDNGQWATSTKRICTTYLYSFTGQKVIIEPTYKNGINVKINGYMKNAIGEYKSIGLLHSGALYNNNTRTELVIPGNCFFRITAYYRYEPAITDENLATLAGMIYVQKSDALEKYEILTSKYEKSLRTNVDETFVTSAFDAQNKNTICFVWASDTHHQVHGVVSFGLSEDKFKEMADVAENVKADFIAVTGDVVNGYYPVVEQKRNLLRVVNNLRDNTTIPIFILEGNHDDNTWYASANGSAGTEYTGLAQTLQNDQFTTYAMNNSIEGVEFDIDNPLSGYYYKDFNKAKVRVVCLNSTDIPYIENADLSLKYNGQSTFGFQERQIKWLADKALKFDEPGWAVILMLHYDSNFAINTQNQINIDNINAIVSAFVSKTSGITTSTTTDFTVNVAYDFTNNASNEVIAWFSGHRHEDNHEVISGVPHIMIINTFNETGGGYDVVTVDRTGTGGNRTIALKRYNGEPLPTYNRSISF